MIMQYIQDQMNITTIINIIFSLMWISYEHYYTAMKKQMGAEHKMLQ